MEAFNQKRKSEFPSPGPRKFPRQDDANDSSATAFLSSNGRGRGGSGKGAKMSFAERMMAKMGHQEGQGLGRGGTGIVKPVEVKLRPTRIGLGAVREMTQQAKDEAKRTAEQRGEDFEDTEEEERKARKRRQGRAKTGNGGAPGWGQDAAPSKRKTVFRTATDIERDVEGLYVPAVLKSIIDATGSETRMLTSAAGLMASVEKDEKEIEAEKISKRARRDLEAFADTWNELNDRQKIIREEEDTLAKQVGELTAEMEQMQKLAEAVEKLQQVTLNAAAVEDESWEAMVEALEILDSQYGEQLQSSNVPQISVGAISLLFKKTIAAWHPLEDPVGCSSYLMRLRGPLGVKPPDKELADDMAKRKRQTTPYESLICTLWLPKIRSAITNEWDPHEPSTLISFVKAWKPLLPDFVLRSVIDTLVMPRLSASLHDWIPRKSSSTPPHIWIFPWLPYMSSRQLDPKSSSGLLSDVNRKFRVAFQSWELRKGLIPGLTPWMSVLGSTLQHTLVKHLLPRLSKYLETEFEVDPAEQEQTMPAFEATVSWVPAFSSSIAMGQLLVASFFPKWLRTLHVWVTSESPDFKEINEWLGWWEEQIPETLRKLSPVTLEFDKAVKMISRARELGDDKRMELPEVQAERIEHEAEGRKKPAHKKEPAKSVEQPFETSFKDIVESWCEDESLLLVPLREAHKSTGVPLFRITASATGKGGVVVYFKGNIVWARQKRTVDNDGQQTESWKPIEMGTALVALAESR